MSKDNFKQINFEALKFIMLPSDNNLKKTTSVATWNKIET